LTLSNCTLAGNSSPATTRNSDARPQSQGGGIYNESPGMLYIMNSTIAFNTKPGGIEGYNIFALNSIIACNKGYNAYNPVKGRNNLEDSLPAKVFGDAKANLGDNGGPTRTIPLSASGSAVGGGIRSGSIAWDSSSPAMRKPAYYSDSKWFWLDTQQPVAAGIEVVEDGTDQRGVKRKNPPSIGAFEFDAAAAGVGAGGVRESGPIRLSAPGRNLLLIRAAAPETYSIELFDSEGRTVSRKEVKLETASRTVDLGRNLAPGVYLAVVRSAKSRAAAKLVLE
jgi:hypothetical protein